MNNADRKDWHVLGDWGSTRLRLWQLRDGQIGEKREGRGIVGLPRSPRDELLAGLAEWTARDGPPTRITLCGMAGARGGLAEAGYAPCPLDAISLARQAIHCELAGIPVVVGAGCASTPRGNAISDVMRGEETQVFGAVAQDPALARGRHSLVLPGTHSKWVTIEAGAIVGLRTFLSGELYALLQGSSLLPPGADQAGPDREAGFAEGLSRARAGTTLAAGLFAARAAQVCHDRPAPWAAGYLSGLILGTEVAEMAAAAAQGPVILIGSSALLARYTAALESLGLVSRALDGDHCVLAGLEMLDAHHG